MATPKAGYRNADGIKLPSVTTILGRFKDSGGLIRWAYKQGRDHGFLDGVRWVYDSFVHALKGAFGSLADAVRPLFASIFPTKPKAAPRDLYDNDDKATAIGTWVHERCEAHVKGWDNPDVPVFSEMEEMQAACVKKGDSAFGAFLKWLEFSRIVILETELGLVSELNQYGGTLDFIGQEPDGNIVMGDFKTSNGVYGEYLYQLAAYAILWEEHHPNKPIKGFHLLRFAKEKGDFVHSYFPELESERQAFLLMRQLFAIDETVKRRV
jgi:hypothetical protein